jgi:hypothetical protein
VAMVEVHQVASAGGYGRRLLWSGLTLVAAPRLVGWVSTGAREAGRHRAPNGASGARLHVPERDAEVAGQLSPASRMGPGRRPPTFRAARGCDPARLHVGVGAARS